MFGLSKDTLSYHKSLSFGWWQLLAQTIIPLSFMFYYHKSK